MRDILTRCEATKAIVKVIPDVLDLMNSKTHVPQLRDVLAEDLIGRHAVTRGEGVDLTPVMNKTVMVTGAAGSIGSELVRQLVHFEPTKLILLDNDESGLARSHYRAWSALSPGSAATVLADITVA